jgi:hypothetical protein
MLRLPSDDCHGNGLYRFNLDVAKMAEVFRGLYRTIAWAYVTNGTMAFRVPEADYRAFGYEPHCDNLPWKENYDEAKGHEERSKY